MSDRIGFPDRIIILAHDDDEAAHMERTARSDGADVVGRRTWEGPVPEGSYSWFSATCRMSTPEFYFLRMANQLDVADAAMLGTELCSYYCTQRTRPTAGSDFVDGSGMDTTKESLRAYLDQIADTEEGCVALSVLECVREECFDPLQAYVGVVASLPRELGGFGLNTPPADVVDDGVSPDVVDDGVSPESVGYMDTCMFWSPEDGVPESLSLWVLRFQDTDAELHAWLLRNEGIRFMVETPAEGGGRDIRMSSDLDEALSWVAGEAEDVLVLPADPEWAAMRERVFESCAPTKLQPLAVPFPGVVYSAELDGSVRRTARQAERREHAR